MLPAGKGAVLTSSAGSPVPINNSGLLVVAASRVLGWLALLTQRSGGEETMAGTQGVCTASLLQEHKHCSVLLPWSWGHRTEPGGLRKAAGLLLKEKFSMKLGTWRKKSELAVIIKTEKISLRAKSAP